MNKKELYEQRKQQKFEQKEQAREEKKKSQLFFALAIVVPLVLVVSLIGYVVYTSSGVNLPDVGELLADQGRTHIQIGESHPPYNSNPPTSGWHYGAPANWGVYQEELPQEQLIHNLEHGGVVIQYKPELDSEVVAKLEDLKNSEFECKLVIAPYGAMEKNIALTAWRRLYTSDTYDEETIKNFIKKYRNTGPEIVPCSARFDHK